MSGCDGGFGFYGGFAFIAFFILLVSVGASFCGSGTPGYGTYC
ncbi:sporulation protein YjcZ [Peribacillus simplex]|uniref:Sporulation protein YjcZ n=2 Tax=Peribacillus TaxID=2675229 RepID=A0AA90PBU6_9BACI|nr:MULTISPECIES: sporulation protein YjcZ [Peribacillus]MDP1420956.1 sporulation protein YjcZ [Peribacillus simplex]MDP1452898.1 sporulation protein YjcZ [Peribacillus frigoritolerans]